MVRRLESPLEQRDDIWPLADMSVIDQVEGRYLCSRRFEVARQSTVPLPVGLGLAFPPRSVIGRCRVPGPPVATLALGDEPIGQEPGR